MNQKIFKNYIKSICAIGRAKSKEKQYDLLCDIYIEKKKIIHKIGLKNHNRIMDDLIYSDGSNQLMKGLFNQFVKGLLIISPLIDTKKGNRRIEWKKMRIKLNRKINNRRTKTCR